jgi:hypothetical protein
MCIACTTHDALQSQTPRVVRNTTGEFGVIPASLDYLFRTFAYLFICLRQHGTFSLFLVILCAAHNITKKEKNLLE